MKLSKIAISHVDALADERLWADSLGHQLFARTQRDWHVAWPIVSAKLEHTSVLLFAVLIGLAFLRV